MDICVLAKWAVASATVLSLFEMPSAVRPTARRARCPDDALPRAIYDQIDVAGPATSRALEVLAAGDAYLIFTSFSMACLRGRSPSQ